MTKSHKKDYPQVFEYLNFRKFLTDWYEWNKYYTQGFSHRSIKEESQLGSRSHFFDVMLGRKLTEKFIANYIRLLKLDNQQSQYFICMVQYEQSASDKVRARAFATMAKISPQLKTLQIGSEMIRFFEHWYQPVLLTILAIYPHEKNPGILSNYFSPKISEAQCKNALELAHSLKVISWDDNNERWVLHNRFISCAESTKELALKPFHRKLQELGIYHYNHTYDRQHFSTLSLATTDKVKAQIEEILKETRSRILDLVKKHPGEDSAFQLNFQLYPLSRPISKKRRPDV